VAWHENPFLYQDLALKKPSLPSDESDCHGRGIGTCHHADSRYGIVCKHFNSHVKGTEKVWRHVNMSSMAFGRSKHIQTRREVMFHFVPGADDLLFHSFFRPMPGLLGALECSRSN
jgi:hypothetical protein